MHVFARAYQAEWREEVKKHFEKIKSEGTCIHRLDEELIRRRRDELRSATDPGATKYSMILYFFKSSYNNITKSFPRLFPTLSIVYNALLGMHWIFESIMRGS